MTMVLWLWGAVAVIFAGVAVALVFSKVTMTLDEAIEIIYDEAARQGEPLTRDVCRQIAIKLLDLTPVISMRPGDIAKFHHQRYDGELP